MYSKSETKLKTLRLKSELINELEELAIKDNRNFNNFVETILMREASKRQTT